MLNEINHQSQHLLVLIVLVKAETVRSQKRKQDHKTNSAPEIQTTAKSDLSWRGGLVSLCMNDVQMWTPRAFLHAELTEIKRCICSFTHYHTKDYVISMDQFNLEAVHNSKYCQT